MATRESAETRSDAAGIQTDGVCVSFVPFVFVGDVTASQEKAPVHVIVLGYLGTPRLVGSRLLPM